MSAADETPARPSSARTGGDAPIRWFGDLDQLEFEVDFFERVLERCPNYVTVLRALVSCSPARDSTPARWKSTGGW